MRSASQVLILFSLLPLVHASAVAQEASSQDTDSPLAPFERLIGGQWHLGESFQEFEWGVGKQSVKVRSFFLVDGSPQSLESLGNVADGRQNETPFGRLDWGQADLHGKL